MSNYIYQVWDNIEHKSVGSFNSHNEAKRKLEDLLEKEIISGKSLTLKLRKQNEMTRINKNDYNDLMVCI